jgi:acetylglutamate kinase
LGFALDPKTHALLEQIREQYNLSSENEALRLAVSLGAKKLLGLLN